MNIHLPAPYSAYGDEIRKLGPKWPLWKGVIIAQCKSAVLGHDVAKANVSYIVRCVNSHEMLMQALQDLLDIVTEREQGNHDLDEELDQAEAALKAVKEMI